MVKICEIECRSILTKSKIPRIDYTICPYIGCLHNCRYCYVRFMGFWKGEWGRDVAVKINGADLLKKTKIREGARISISTATDPYQPPEKDYRITRAILRELTKFNLSLSILTKSSLVTRDIDILKEISDIEVGFSITTIDERIRKSLEPGASSIGDRLSALERLRSANIKTYIFIAPILPNITEKGIEKLILLAKGLGVDRIVVDRLNYAKRLRLFARFSDTYFERTKDQIAKECRVHNIPCEVCF